MAVSTINIGTQPEKTGKLIFTGANDFGPQLVITLSNVMIAPSAATNFIGDEYGLLEVTGEVLADDTGSFGTVEHPDGTAAAPNVNNYYVGTGVVTWTPESGGTARDVGNVNVFEFNQAATPLDHWSHRGGIRKKDFRPIVEQSATVRLVMDEFTAENLKLALLAA